jgi:DNA-binding PadR family transcriptional regulator
MHGYEIQSIIQESRMDQWANVLSGSIYYALNKLEEEGTIKAVKEERTGARMRKIYRITPQGEEEYKKLLKENLKAAPHSLKSDFMLSLSMAEQISKEEIIPILQDNLNQLRKIKTEWIKGKEIKAKTPAFNPLMEYSFDNTLQVLEADIQLLEKVIAYIKNK